jgi:tRNA threonylcarbamoyladenosine biosynthesis protein TsaB
MLLLAVDTAGRQGGITLARGDGDHFEVVESASIEGGTFSAELIPQISDLLTKHKLTAQHLEGLVAVTGPGSFTGIRVGLTAVKGLAEVLRIPIAAVTSLDVLIAAADRGRVLGVLDAGRGEVYGVAPGEAELLLNIAEAVHMAKERGLQVVTPDANLAAKFENARTVTYRSSEVAAGIGLKKLSAADTIDVLALDANYIRKSEAEYMQKLKR